jgi:hypothetical protein
MTPEFNKLVAEIQAKNIANTHGELDKLVTKYGEAFHNFVEDDPLAKPPPKALKLKVAELTAAQTGIGKLLPLSHGLTLGGGVTPGTATKKADNCRGHAQVDAASAKGETGDEASESFVDAAMWYFREAVCVYAANDLGAAKPDPSARLRYATALFNSASMLMQAALNEDNTDYSEIMAENVLANLLFKEALPIFDDIENLLDVKKTLKMPAAQRQVFDDNHKACAKGVDDTKANIGKY